MNIFKYKVSKEEYIRNLELKLKKFGLLKLMIFISKIIIILMIMLLLLNLYFRSPYVLIFMEILTITFGLLIVNRKNFIRIKLIKYNILEIKNKLERKLEWDNENFKIYNNKKLIINSYNDIKNIIESDKFLILNYGFKNKNTGNIIIPKDELCEVGIYEDLKESVIKNIGKDKHKNLDVKFFDVSNIGAKDYALVLTLFIILIVIIILFLAIVI